jgi:hypothetical protein
MTNPECGYYYIVYGRQPFYEEAVNSIKSLRVVDPKAHVTAISYRESESLEDVCDQVIVDRNLDFRRSPLGKEKIRGLQGKTIKMAEYIPYKKTFFVDTDTYWCESGRELFNLLDNFDMLLTPDPSESNTRDIAAPPYPKIEGLVPPNLGVLLYRRNKKVKTLLEETRKYQLELPKRKYYPDYPGQEGAFPDQPYFTSLLLRSNVRTYFLPSVWNLQWRKWTPIQGTVKIIHGRINPKEFTYEWLKNKMNENPSPSWLPSNRCWNPEKREVMSSKNFIMSGVR